MGESTLILKWRLLCGKDFCIDYLKKQETRATPHVQLHLCHYKTYFNLDSVTSKPT